MNWPSRTTDTLAVDEIALRAKTHHKHAGTSLAGETTRTINRQPDWFIAAGEENPNLSWRRFVILRRNSQKFPSIRPEVLRHFRSAQRQGNCLQNCSLSRGIFT